jgi:hypothetical protein
MHQKRTHVALRPVDLLQRRKKRSLSEGPFPMDHFRFGQVTLWPLPSVVLVGERALTELSNLYASQGKSFQDKLFS